MPVRMPQHIDWFTVRQVGVDIDATACIRHFNDEKSLFCFKKIHYFYLDAIHLSTYPKEQSTILHVFSEMHTFEYQPQYSCALVRCSKVKKKIELRHFSLVQNEHVAT